MSTNKSISYLLCNKGIIINLYKLHFQSSHFSFQPNKRVFYPLTFPSLQLNTHEEKLNIFYPPTFHHSTNFPSSSTPPTKQTLKHQHSRKTKKLFCILKYHFIYFTNLFHNSPNILVFIFTYNSMKLYKLTNKIIKSTILSIFSHSLFLFTHYQSRFFRNQLLL